MKLTRESSRTRSQLRRDVCMSREYGRKGGKAEGRTYFAHGPFVRITDCRPDRASPDQSAIGGRPLSHRLGLSPSRLVEAASFPSASGSRIPPLAHVHRLWRGGRGSTRRGRDRLRTLAPGNDAAVTDHPHVVIVGGGFAGLLDAKGLRRAQVRVKVVDRKHHQVV